MKFSVDWKDEMFGERIEVGLPQPDGQIVKRSVTKKWFDQMVSNGTIRQVGKPVVRVHVLNTDGYSVQHWVVGENIPADLVEQYSEEGTGDIYAVIAAEDGRVMLSKKAVWEAIRTKLEAS